MQRTTINQELVSTYIAGRAKQSDKHEYGHALLIAGSYGMLGAACLAAKASLRSGLGLLTVLSPQCAYNILQTVVPEAMVMPTGDDEYLYALPDINRFKYIATGPGLSTHPDTETFIDDLLLLNKKMIIDADAINIIAKNNWQSRIADGSLICPNLNEFNRFFNTNYDLTTARENFEALVSGLKINVILKGSESLLSIAGKGVYVNTTGNPGMAKAGSGDVLTGMLLALWSRYQDLERASILGVYLHGKAGDMAMEKSHVESLIASDIIEAIPLAFRHSN